MTVALHAVSSGKGATRVGEQVATGQGTSAVQSPQASVSSPILN